MAGIVDSFENELLNAFTGITPLSLGDVYIALFSSDPTDTGSVSSELLGMGYTRLKVLNYFPVSSAATGISSNSSAIIFSPSTGTWNIVAYIGFMKSATVGADDMDQIKLLSREELISVLKRTKL